MKNCPGNKKWPALFCFLRYLLAPEGEDDAGPEYGGAPVGSWLRRHGGRIKALFWCAMSLVLALAVSRLH